jgi:hypothetical protein
MAAAQIFEDESVDEYFSQAILNFFIGLITDVATVAGWPV